MDKEALRRLFGQIGDVSSELEKMFGEIYLDQPDKTRDHIPEEIVGSNVFNIGPLIDAVIERSPVIDCIDNQTRILKFLNGYLQGENVITHNEWWSVIKHMDNCNEEPCHELYRIACQDKYLTPEAMREDYGDKIKNWKIK